MRVELSLVLKHVTRGEEKVNVVNYLNRTPYPVEEYYYEPNMIAIKDHMVGIQTMSTNPTYIIGA